MPKIIPPFRAPVWFWALMSFSAALNAPCFAQAPITNGLVARWPGDGNAKDSAGHFDGQVSGGLRYGPGPTGKAFEFNGGSSRVDFGPAAGNFGTRDFTISYWMKTDSKSSQQAFLGKRATCDGASCFWDIRIGGGYSQNPPTGVLHIEFAPGGYKPPYDLFSSRPLNDGQWHHIAWVRQSTSSGSIACLIYVDGALDNSKNYPEAVDLANQLPLVMGRDVCEGFDGTTPYSGSAAELQFFSHALSEEEILTLYKAGKPRK